MQEEKRNGDAGGHDDGQRALNLTEYPTDFVRSVLPVVEQTDHTKRAFGTARTKPSIFVINGTASFEILYYIQGSWVDYQVGLSYLLFLLSPIAFLTYRLMRSMRLTSSISLMELSKDAFSSIAVIIPFLILTLQR